MASRPFVAFARLIPGLAALALASCAHSGPGGLADSDHPLVGKIWDVAARRFVDPATLQVAVDAAPIVLLGETHDNAEHHRVQREILGMILARGRRPALVMEQFDIGVQARVAEAQERPDVTPEILAEAGRFDREGWGWRHYEPLVKMAIDARAPIVAANLSRGELRQVAKSGLSVLGERRFEPLGFDVVWSAPREAALAEEILLSHCGKLPPSLVPRLSLSQRARDAAMAEAIVPWVDRGVVGILGRGHVRRDLAVPLYLQERLPAARVVSIGLMEVSRGENAPDDYLPKPVAGSVAFDFLWFTRRAERADPCTGLDFKGAS